MIQVRGRLMNWMTDLTGEPSASRQASGEGSEAGCLEP
jgi:hypothetical protein